MIKVQKTRILTTTLDVYSAYEQSTITGNHSTITFFDGQCFGRIGTNPNKELYQDLPIGEQRSKMVNRAYEEQYNRAYQEIYKVYPELLNIEHKRDMGQIEVWN